MEQFKFKENGTAFVLFASFDNGKKGFYEKVKIKNRWVKEKNNYYSFIHDNNNVCSSCLECLLLTEQELIQELKKGSKLV